MSMIENLLNWSRETFLPFGEFGLFLVAFMESSFFPVPPDLILIPLVLLNPQLALWYALVCLAGSVMGAVFGYYIGFRGGRPVLNKLVSESKILHVENYFKKYGVAAVGIAALTPIPYKIFTITAGVMKLDLKKFVLVSILGRGGRFFPLAIVLMLYGESIMGLLIQYFEMFLVAVVIVAVILWMLYKKVKGQ